ncbi:dCTP deaminase [Halomarina oriensis]|uniref:dCTP deaminase n=1 Tax=Halomarina oriensis TaxID=671145 RepID=A0A6B0GNT3_9EURY|nr:dCTP deaminase [Halomarina oriensis]MWG35611.1 dCTP deaminase [Halomarina oriensis]
MTDDAATFLSGFVHEETQVDDGVVDLTLATVHRLDEGGAVDFGGDELAAAETTPIDTESRDGDDDYGWWNLDAGTYLVEHNERLDAENTTFSLQPRTELVERGATHPTLFVTELPALPLTVPEPGIALKENARISTLRSPIR